MNRHSIALLLATLAIVAFSLLTVLPDWRAGEWLALAAGVALLLTAVGLWHAAELDRSVWQNAIDAMQASVVAYDSNDCLLFTNADFRRLFQLSDRDTAPGMPYEQLLRALVQAGQLPEAQGREEAWIAERIAQRRKGGGVSLRQMADGRWRRLVEQRLPDGTLLTFSVDITELIESQRALEAARRDSEEAHRLLHDAIEAMPAAVEVYDRTDRLVVFNQRMLAMYPHMAGQPVQGETFETLVRRAVAQGAVPEARGREVEWLAERLALRGRSTEPRLQRAPDGSWIHIYETPTPGGGMVTVRLPAAEFVPPRE